MPTSKLGRGIFQGRIRSLFWVVLCVVYVSITFFAPQQSASVGIIPDDFLISPKRKDEVGIFTIPEILVILKPTIMGALMDVEAVRLERWEHIYGTVGYAAGFVKRDAQDGKLKMCACTKYTNILSSTLKSEMDKRRQEEIEKITDFNDLELDQRIESECDSAGTYKGCVDIETGVTPDACSFCSAFIKENPSRVLPLAFSKQTYFDPGVRMLGTNGSGTQDVYTGVYGRYWERVRGVTHKFCQGAVKNLVWGVTECIMEARKKSSEPVGYTVYRGEDDNVCLHGKYDSGTSLDCVPAPQLQRPIVEARSNGNGLRVKFPECKDRDGADTKYCDLEMNLGDKDEDVGFSVIKPKIDDQYEFKKVQKCPNGAGDISSCYYEYENDPNGNVTCITDLKHAQRRYYVKRGGRYHWLKELPKVLTARAYDPTAHRYIQCSDSKSVDLSKINQNIIDTMTIRGNAYSFLQSNPANAGSPCDGDISYIYSNYRSLKYAGTCKQDDKENLHKEGYCRTKYISADDYAPFFLQEGESYAQGSVAKLNDMLQGLCVSNFPNNEYKYVAANDRGNKGVNKHILNITKDNTACDFLKIEMWGGGESGSLSRQEGAGKPGTYVMGILKVVGNEGKHLVINVGKGGAIDPAGTGDMRIAGKNTTVSLCSDYGARSCTFRLVAKGGGERNGSSSGHESLLHYRMSEGKSRIAADEVFIPYQGEDDPTEGSIYAEKAGCVRSNTADIKSIKIAAQSTFRGAGGCADKIKRIVQSGTDGAVRLTCEKWSGTPGVVKNWSAPLCDAKFLSYLQELRGHALASKLSGSVVSFFDSIANKDFCEVSGEFPKFSSAIEDLHTLVLDKDSTKNVNLGSRKDISKWINSTVDQLIKALDTEGEIFDTYLKEFSKDKNSSRDQVKNKFIESFRELVRTRVPAYASTQDIVRYADAIERHARKYSTKLGGMFKAMQQEVMAKAVSENSELVGFLKDFTTALSKGSITFENESEFESWMDSYRKRLKKILDGDEEVVSIYMDIESKSTAGQKGKRDSKVIEQAINDVTKEIRDVLRGEVKLKHVTATTKKSTENLKRYADKQKLRTSGVFTRLASGTFLKNVIDKQEFLDAVDSISNAVGIPDDVVAVNTKAEKKAWIDNKMAPLSAALDKDTKVVTEYKKIHSNPGMSDAQAKRELLDAFQELLDGKVVIDHKGMLRTLESIKQRAQDSGLEPQHVAVLGKLSSEEVAKAVVQYDVVRELLEVISSVKDESNTFDGKEYKKEAVREYMKKATSDPEIARFLNNTLKIAPQNFEESMGAFVEKIVEKKKVVLSYDIQEAVQEITRVVRGERYIVGISNALFRHPFREVMQKNACFVAAFYAIANAYTAINEMKENFYLEFLREEQKNNVKKALGDELLECLRIDQSFAKELSQFGYIYYTCNRPEECMQIFASFLVDRIERELQHPDLKDSITERIKMLFQSSWRIIGSEPNAADYVVDTLTGGEAWRCYSENSTVVYLMEKLIRARASSVTHYHCETRSRVGTVGKRLEEAIKAHWTCNDIFVRTTKSRRGYSSEHISEHDKVVFYEWLSTSLKAIEGLNFAMSSDCGDAHKLEQRIGTIANTVRSTHPEVASIFDIMLSDKDLLRSMANSGFQELFTHLEDVTTNKHSTAAPLHTQVLSSSLECMHDNEQAREAINAYHHHYLKHIDEIIKLSFVRSIMRDETSRTATGFALNGIKEGYPYASTRILYHAILHAME